MNDTVETVIIPMEDFEAFVASRTILDMMLESVSDGGYVDSAVTKAALKVVR